MTNPRKYVDFRYITKMPDWLTVVQAGTTYALVNGEIKSFASGTPRIINGKGFMHEASVENLIYYSRNFNDGVYWGLVGTSVTVTGSAPSIIEATANNSGMGQSVTLPINYYTSSVYLKRVSGSGVVSISMNGTDYYPCVLTDEWQRFSITALMANPGVYIKIATSGDEVAADCAQIELGVYPTSPILTTNAPATRAADELYTNAFDFTTLDSFQWFGEAEGTFAMGVELYQADPTNTLLNVLYYPDDNADYLNIKVQNGAAQTFDLGYNGSQEFDFAPNTSKISKSYSVASSYSAGVQLLSVNGSSPASGTSADTPDFSTTNRIYFGSKADLSEHINGYVTWIAYYTEVLTQSELDAITRVKPLMIDNDGINERLITDFFTRVYDDSGTVEGASCLITLMDAIN